MQIIEVCSYPKSGNTWLCKLIDQLLSDAGVTNVVEILGIHGHQEKVLRNIENKNGASFPESKRALYIYKSHTFNNVLVNPDKVLYIYRHPLDVFLSTLNWFYISLNYKPESYPAHRKSQLFLNGIPKTPEQIIQDGELDYYLDRYIENLGGNFYPGMLKESGNIFTHISSAVESPKAVCIKYEDLFENTKAVFLDAMEQLLETGFSSVDIDISNVNKKTKGTGQPFYWKAKSGTRFDLLTKAQIERFENAHGEKLEKIGF